MIRTIRTSKTPWLHFIARIKECGNREGMEQDLLIEPPNGGTDKHEFWCMLAIGAFALIVYSLTLSPGVVPGESALSTASAMGLLPAAKAVHPFWHLLTHGLARIPSVSTPVALNAFSALCGSLSAMLVFKMTKRVVFETIREPPSIRVEPVGADEDISCPKPDTGDYIEYIAATSGAALTSFVLIFSAPFWQASVALHDQSFLVLLVLVTLDRLFCYLFTGKTSVCVSCLLLTGIGCVESVVFIVLAPIVFYVALRSSVRLQHICESFLLTMSGAFFVGVAVNLSLALAQEPFVSSIDMTVIMQTTARLASNHLYDLLAGLPRHGGLLIVLQALVPLSIAALAVRHFSSYSNESVQWMWGIAGFLSTGAALAFVLNVPTSAWHLAQKSGHLPVFPSLSVAIALGLLLVFWILNVHVPRLNNESELAPPPFGLRLLGNTMIILVWLVSFYTANMNGKEANAHHAAFADQLADEILAQANSAGARYLVVGGVLDLNLLIRAHESSAQISVIPGPSDWTGTSTINRTHALKYYETEGPSLSENLFIDILSADPSAYAHIAVFGPPDLWRQAGYEPVPTGILYAGTHEIRRQDIGQLWANHLARTESITTCLADTPHLRPDLLTLKTQLRKMASRVSNDFGVILESCAHDKEALASYSKALTFNDDNISARLNMGGLLGEKDGSEGKYDAAVLLQPIAEHPNVTNLVETAESLHGDLSYREADRLLPTLATKLDPYKDPDSRLISLYLLWLQKFSNSLPKERPLTTDFSLPKQVSSEATPLSLAISMLREGRNSQAESLLKLYSQKQPTHFSAWALLAEALMRRSAYQEIEEQVLPCMRKDCKTDSDTALVEIVQGLLYLNRSPQDTTQARACFSLAMSQHSKLQAIASEQLLAASWMEGDLEHLEKDAKLILKHDSQHVVANAMLGSLFLSQRRLEEAETYLTRSIQNQPTAGALNDLANISLQRGAFSEAERLARQAIRIKTDCYQAWDTLGCVLLETKRMAEVEPVLRYAVLLGRDDARVYLTLCRLRLLQQRHIEARQALVQAHACIGHASSDTRAIYTALNDQMAAVSP